ncbi:hypothetical protein JCM17823_11090 [Halorubrum gandharaense]
MRPLDGWPLHVLFAFVVLGAVGTAPIAMAVVDNGELEVSGVDVEVAGSGDDDHDTDAARWELDTSTPTEDGETATGGGSTSGASGAPTTPAQTPSTAADSDDADTPSIEVVQADLADARITEGETTSVTATAHNDGSAAGEREITLYRNGTEMATETVTLAPDERTSLEFAVEGAGPGEYAYTVERTDAGTLVVERVTAAPAVAPYPELASLIPLLLGVGLISGYYVFVRRRR